jgi:hypothetical protein
MKALFVVLLTANVVVGAWLFLSGPVDVMREPARMDLQVDAGKIRLLSDAELARMRSQAERTTSTNAIPAAPKVEAPKVEAPAVQASSTACVEIGNFASEAAAKKARARLAAIGLSDRTSANTAGRTIRLRVAGVDAATQARIDEILKDYPKQRLERCAEATSAR